MRHTKFMLMNFIIFFLIYTLFIKEKKLLNFIFKSVVEKIKLYFKICNCIMCRCDKLI